jgi:uncharacterized membrane protein HdeD (DUF308 family)
MSSTTRRVTAVLGVLALAAGLTMAASPALARPHPA